MKQNSILKLPICRVRQMLELIIQQRTEEFRAKAKIVEWQTRQIAISLSALARTKDQSKAFNNLINKMKLPLPDEEVVDNRSMEEIIEQGALIDDSTLPSFDALAATLGGLERGK